MATTLAAPEQADGLAQRPPVIVEGHSLIRRYGDGDAEVLALRGVTLSVAQGELVAVMGPSGSGKSTLMHTLAGLDRPDEGEVWIADTEITGLGDNALTKLRRRHVGFIFQFFNLLPMLTAEENVLLPLRIAGQKPEPRSSPAGSSSVSPSLERWCPGPR
jgi:putative ABC transport system ATP-binding protein